MGRHLANQQSFSLLPRWSCGGAAPLPCRTHMPEKRQECLSIYYAFINIIYEFGELYNILAEESEKW